MRITRPVASTSVSVLGDLIREFIGCRPYYRIINRSDGVIKGVEGEDKYKEMLRKIKRAANTALVNKAGSRRPVTAASLNRHYGYEVVAITKDEAGWLDVGIKTSIGIIPYDNV